MLFYSCDLDLFPMIFMYELNPYFMSMYLHTKNELSGSKLTDSSDQTHLDAA